MLYILNQKSHFTKEELLLYRKEIEKYPLKDNVVFAPSTCFLPLLEGFSLAAQDVSPFQVGAYTGDVNASSLASLGVSYVLIGHSERRKYWKEDIDLLEQKIRRVLEASMIPILCIGETKEEYQNGKTIESLEKSLLIFERFPQEMWKNIIIAYEPIWSIGTGKSLEKESIEKIVSWIKGKVLTKVLYGGSLYFPLIQELRKNTSLDGFLIGGMSLKVEEIIRLLQES